MSAEPKKAGTRKALEGILGALGSLLAAILVGFIDLAKALLRKNKK